MGETKFHQVAPVAMQHIEHVIDDGTFASASILQRLKTCSASLVQSDNLAIEHEIALRQLPQSKNHVLEVVAVIATRHRVEQRCIPVNDANGAITVLLDFVQPVITLRQGRNSLALHWLD